MPKSRLEAFSDGIIAFAVTLLIYDFHLQNVDAVIDNAGLIHALLALCASLLHLRHQLPNLHGLVDGPPCVHPRFGPRGFKAPLA
jgi:uncharacterized membrane protein